MEATTGAAIGAAGLGESSSTDSRSFTSGDSNGKTGIIPAHLLRTENENANPSVVEIFGAHMAVG